MGFEKAECTDYLGRVDMAWLIVSQAELQAPTGSVTVTILLTSAATQKVQRPPWHWAFLESFSRVTVINPKTQWNSLRLSHFSPLQLIASNSAS
jgi:hypothetical protein